MTSEPADPTRRPDATPGLRANRDFQLVLSGQAVSALGDAITLTAMPLLVLFLTGSGALMGIVGALQVVPDLVIGLPIGALADRWDRRRMMLWADAGRAVLTMAIPISFWLGWSTIAVILIVTVPINVLRVISDAGFTSSIPGLVGREHLGRANSYLEATLSVPYIVGPALAGILVATIGAATTIAIDAATFALSAATLVFVRRTLRAERGPSPSTLLADIRQGIDFVRRNVVVRSIIAFWGTLQIATAALIPTLGFYLTIDRGLGPELFGFLGSIWSVGYLAGSLLVGRLGDRRVGLRMVVAAATMGAAIVAIALAPQPAVHLGAAAIIGAALAIVLVSYATLRAAATPDALLGRVGSAARVVTVGLQPIGLVVAGVMIELTSATGTLIGMGGLAIVASVLFGLSRSFREAGVDPQPPAGQEPADGTDRG